jgi:tRNA U34 2-thiouridine synthase MnmA/TrmU
MDGNDGLGKREAGDMHWIPGSLDLAGMVALFVLSNQIKSNHFILQRNAFKYVTTIIYQEMTFIKKKHNNYQKHNNNYYQITTIRKHYTVKVSFANNKKNIYLLLWEKREQARKPRLVNRLVPGILVQNSR